MEAIIIFSVSCHPVLSSLTTYEYMYTDMEATRMSCRSSDAWQQTACCPHRSTGTCFQCPVSVLVPVRFLTQNWMFVSLHGLLWLAWKKEKRGSVTNSAWGLRSLQSRFQLLSLRTRRHRHPAQNGITVSVLPKAPRWRSLYHGCVVCG